MQTIICFGTICESIVHLVAIIRNKTSIMDLSGPVDFEGKLDHIPTWWLQIRSRFFKVADPGETSGY